MNSGFKTALCIFLLLFAFYSSADALIRVVRPTGELFGQAQSVVLVEIISLDARFVDGEVCGIKYSAKIKYAFKGGRSGDVVQFGRMEGLAIGAQYILFLNKIVDPEIVFHELKRYFPDETDEKLLKVAECDGLIPGLQFVPENEWELLGNEVRLTGFLPEPFRSWGSVRSPGDMEWYIKYEEVRNYLDALNKQ